MSETKRLEICSYSSLYQRTFLKVLVIILLMEALMLSSQKNVGGSNEGECKWNLMERIEHVVNMCTAADLIAMQNTQQAENISNSNELIRCNILRVMYFVTSILNSKSIETRRENESINPAAPNITESTLDFALNTTSNLLSSACNKEWMRRSPFYRSKTATRLLVFMEMISNTFAEVINHPGSIVKAAPEIEGLQINIINMTEAELQQSSITFSDYGLQLEMGLEDVKRRASKADGLGRVAFIQYNNIGKWLKSNVTVENKSYVGSSFTLITKVFLASIFPPEEHRTLLNSSITFTILHQISPNSSNVSCVFWNFSSDFDGHWSDEGCKVVSSNEYNTTCECDHLTHFAVLMSSVEKEISPNDVFALQIITYIGCTISIVCLALALFTFCFFRNLQCDKNTIHKNLAFSLLIAQLIFVCGINQYDKKALCTVVAGFLHYFFLASFAWMCIEGVQLYILLVEVFEIEKSRVMWYYLGGYGTPALIVLSSLSVLAYSSDGARGAYGTEKHCWLSMEPGAIWAFNGPVIAVFAVNLVMLGLAIYMTCKHSSVASWKLKNKSKIHEIGSWLRGAAIIMTLLGTTWIFGIFLTFDNQTVVFEYIFAIVNSLQGLFIFVFHCLTNEKVQKEYQVAIQRSTCLPECIRAKCGDMSKGVVLSTPNMSRFFEKTTARLISSYQKDQMCQRRTSSASGSPPTDFFVGSLDESDNLGSTEDSNGVPVSAIIRANDNKFNV